MVFIDLLSEFFQILESFLGSNSIVTFIIFAVMIYVLYKFVKFAFKIFIVVIAGLLFPFAMNYILNMSIPITIESLTFYATTAAILFVLVSMAQKITWVLEKINSGINKLYNIGKEKKMKKEIEEDLKEKIENLLKKKKSKT